LRNCIDLTNISNFLELLFLSLLFCLLSSLINSIFIDLVADTVPKVLKSKAKEFISHHGRSVNSSNLGSFPTKWFNPFGQQLVVVVTSSFNNCWNSSISSCLICCCRDKYNLFESSSHNHTILNNSISVTCSLKNWSSEIECTSSKLLSLLGLDLLNRHWFISRWSDFIVDNN
jgi:hypothetical protein